MHSQNLSSRTSELQRAIELIETLDLESQAILIDIIDKRIKQKRREKLVKEVREAEQEFAEGKARRMSVADFIAELED